MLQELGLECEEGTEWRSLPLVPVSWAVVVQVGFICPVVVLNVQENGLGKWCGVLKPLHSHTQLDPCRALWSNFKENIQGYRSWRWPQVRCNVFKYFMDIFFYCAGNRQCPRRTKLFNHITVILFPQGGEFSILKFLVLKINVYRISVDSWAWYEGSGNLVGNYWFFHEPEIWQPHLVKMSGYGPGFTSCVL